MDSNALSFFKEALATPSPSGYETPVQELVRQYAADFADEVSTDVHGNVIAVKNPQAKRRVMLAGHCDQIGLVVTYIDDDGYLYVQSLGGWDLQQLVGQRMTVWTAEGAVLGIIARKAIHLLTEEERKQVPKMKDLWIDIGAKNKEQAQEQVRIGDPVTVDLALQPLLNNRLAAPAMDDKAGMWVVIEALRRVDASKLDWAVHAVSTVQEELGIRGARTSAFGIDPEVGVAVDVTHSTDCPTIEKKQEGDIKMGDGPVVYRGPNMNPRVVELLLESARDNDIPVQLAASGRPPGTDANIMQLTRAGVATSLVSVPNRYMHSPVEMISLDDLDQSADLLARFVEALPPAANFIP